MYLITSQVNKLPIIKHLLCFNQVLELSPRGRQRNSMLAAVYVGPSKPLMAQFLHPVAAELRALRRHGVTWRPNGNQEVVSRFMTHGIS